MTQEQEKPTAVDEARPQTHTPPPYKVILHNDDVNYMEYVVETIAKLTPLSTEEAVIKALEAHNAGLAVLLVCHKERAELYQEQFQSASLTVTIEPD
ncbi:MAG: ATP-dependent Clp protease adaptor ClpS [Phycisphaerae bacterium]|nr:ATP-dependent Clp protease adaptor ClpS [Phycisphaerae bacterium]